jgi:hypothetical protein
MEFVTSYSTSFLQPAGFLKRKVRHGAACGKAVFA